MPAGRPCSSKRGAIAIAVVVLGLSGCAGGLTLAPALAPPPDLRTSLAGEPDAVVPAQPRTTAVAMAEPAPRFLPVSDQGPASDMVQTAALDASHSQWCRYLREQAAADALILRAPTVSGEVDDSGKSSLNVGLSYAGIRKAQLTEQAAEIKCRRYLAENGLQKQLFLAPLEFTAAGYQAKATAIRARHGEMEELRSRIRRELRSGNITADRASALTVSIEQLYAAEGEAMSQVKRREALAGAPVLRPGLDAELIRAEQDLQALESKLRTADAFDVSVEAGYSDAKMSNGFDTMSQGFSGRLKFSMKLGAFAPQRYEHEAAATDARIAALRTEDSGPLWQARVLRDAQLKSIAGLADSLAKIDAAIASAQTLVRTIGSVSQPDLAGADIAARLQVIQLQTTRAGVAGSIAEIRQTTSELPNG